ncbi:hypothetical protein X798_01611 [Onchocerca flexuosa]|uniref:Uncharacterized protein n=1 Tax=Onchocerca flexuosa TaxID=387005 RepID=A0A238C239_9BILA|nr:hypothetical protein X798_01611 [Onchocerca flexuosa]
MQTEERLIAEQISPQFTGSTFALCDKTTLLFATTIKNVIYSFQTYLIHNSFVSIREMVDFTDIFNVMDVIWEKSTEKKSRRAHRYPKKKEKK